MKNIFTAIILGAIVFFAKHYYDTRYERALIGNWEMNAAYKEANVMVELEMEETYLKDGTSSGDGKILMYIGGQYLGSAIVKWESTWRVKDNFLYETATSVKMGRYRGDGRLTEIFDAMKKEMKKSVNTETESEILGMQGNQMRVRTEDNIVMVGTRR